MPVNTPVNGGGGGGGGGAVDSVNGKTGSVTIGKADVGLSNVDNTSDANKPISTAMQSALDGKATPADIAAAISALPEGPAGADGAKGDKGDKGDNGSAASPQNATADLSAFQVVYGTPEGGVLPASPTDDATIDLILGVTLSAVAAGATVQVQRSGIVTDPSLAIYPAGTRLYLSAGGTLTTIAPSSGYDVFIGTALGAGRVLFDVQPPIFLE